MEWIKIRHFRQQPAVELPMRCQWHCVVGISCRQNHFWSSSWMIRMSKITIDVSNVTSSSPGCIGISRFISSIRAVHELPIFSSETSKLAWLAFQILFLRDMHIALVNSYWCLCSGAWSLIVSPTSGSSYVGNLSTNSRLWSVVGVAGDVFYAWYICSIDDGIATAERCGLSLHLLLPSQSSGNRMGLSRLFIQYVLL